MLQLRNESPFVPGLFLFPDEQGVDTLYVVVKATFELEGTPVHCVKAATTGARG